MPARPDRPPETSARCPPPRDGATDLVALVPVEVESRDSVATFRPRMFDYHVQLRSDTGLPVLPIALLLRVGLDDIGRDVYEEHFWEERIVRFEYAYVGLPELQAEDYATGENLLGVALSALMRQSGERRAEMYAEGLKRIARSGENDLRRFPLKSVCDIRSPAFVRMPQLGAVDAGLETRSSPRASPALQGWAHELLIRNN